MITRIGDRRAQAQAVPLPPNLELEACYQYCEALCRAHHHNYPVASFFARSHLRKHIFAMFAFARVADGEDGCILAYGVCTYAALDVRRRVLEMTGRALAVVDARFAKPLDEVLIRHELERQPVVFTLEDHGVACGFGSAVAELALTGLAGEVDASKLELLGVPLRFIDHGDRTEQFAAGDLDVATLTARVVARLERVRPLLRAPRRASAGAHP